MSRRFYFPLLVAALFFRQGVLLAAPCCGAGASGSTLLSGDERGLLSLSLAHTRVIGDAPLQGVPVFRAGDDNEFTQTLTLGVAHLLADRWQAGAELGVVRKQIGGAAGDESAIGFADSKWAVAYEILPEWTYSSWRPKGLWFVGGTIPTGRSVYEGAGTETFRVTGRGFFSVGTGLFMTKGFGAWDFSLAPQIEWVVPRRFERTGGNSLSLGSGSRLSVGVGAGVVPFAGSVRLGLRLEPSFASARSVRSVSGESTSGAQLVWNLAATCTYSPSAEWSYSLALNDQTLFGPAQNTTLERGAALSVVFRPQR